MRNLRKAYLHTIHNSFIVLLLILVAPRVILAFWKKTYFTQHLTLKCCVSGMLYGILIGRLFFFQNYAEKYEQQLLVFK